MPYIVQWTEHAEERLFETLDYLNDFSPEAAEAAFDTITLYSENLEKLPYRGRPAGMVEEGYQELLVPFGASGYILLYEITGETIFIHSVKHQKQANY